MQTPEKPFNDFFLLGLSHLSGFETLLPPRIALQENQIRLEYGKKAIREHTVKGDLIAFEGPEERTFDYYKKICEARGIKITPEKEKRLLAKWQNLGKAALNFHFELAQYAESIGRGVVSLEPNIRKPASALDLAYERGYAKKKKEWNICSMKNRTFLSPKEFKGLNQKWLLLPGDMLFSLKGNSIQQKRTTFQK